MYARPGGWNDPDMLIGSSSGTAARLTPDQSRSMFSLWSVMSAPLLIGSNIRNLNSWDLETYSNSEVIAVNQDRDGRQGTRIAGGNLRQGGNTFNIWAKKLSDGSWAVVFLNNADTAADVTCNADCFSKMDFKATDTLKVRDLWKHMDAGTVKGSYTAKMLPAKGGYAVLKFTPQ